MSFKALFVFFFPLTQCAGQRPPIPSIRLPSPGFKNRHSNPRKKKTRIPRMFFVLHRKTDAFSHPPARFPPRGCFCRRNSGPDPSQAPGGLLGNIRFPLPGPRAGPSCPTGFPARPKTPASPRLHTQTLSPPRGVFNRLVKSRFFFFQSRRRFWTKQMPRSPLRPLVRTETTAHTLPCCHPEDLERPGHGGWGRNSLDPTWPPSRPPAAPFVEPGEITQGAPALNCPRFPTQFRNSKMAGLCQIPLPKASFFPANELPTSCRSIRATRPIPRTLSPRSILKPPFPTWINGLPHPTPTATLRAIRRVLRSARVSPPSGYSFL